MASAAKIPLIDISTTGQDAELQVAKELVEAAVEHGFVYLRNTGGDIPPDAVDRAFDLVNILDTGSNRVQCMLTDSVLQGKKIFDAPLEEKVKCTIQKNNHGWGGLKYETLDPKNQKVVALIVNYKVSS
jgi:hypothetical protein